MLKIVKIGGNVVDNPEQLDHFLSGFASLGGPKILVHGGGKIATTTSKALGINTQMIDGRRVTDAQTLDVVTMVYAGLVNKTIVNKLNAAGCKAIGLSGADGGFILSDKRFPLPVDYGFVGDPKSVDTSLSDTLTGEGYTLVVAPITTDGQGTLLNTNADTVAQSVAVAMAQSCETELVFCFEKRGVLADVEDDASVIPIITRESFAALRENGTVSQGMLPKLENAFKALDKGVRRVVICHAGAIAEPGYGGTSIEL